MLHFLQDGPETDSTKNDEYFDVFADLDDSPHSFSITEPVDPASSDAWLKNVGVNIY